MEEDEKELGTGKKRLKKREERVEKLRLFSGGGGSKSISFLGSHWNGRNVLLMILNISRSPARHWPQYSGWSAGWALSAPTMTAAWSLPCAAQWQPLHQTETDRCTRIPHLHCRGKRKKQNKAVMSSVVGCTVVTKPQLAWFSCRGSCFAAWNTSDTKTRQIQRHQIYFPSCSGFYFLFFYPHLLLALFLATPHVTGYNGCRT